MKSDKAPNIDQVIKEFEKNDIGWKGGQAIFDWWHEARGDRPFPSRSDFSPTKMPSLLANIQLIDVGDEERHYSVRLAGTAITETLGFDPTGVALKDIPKTENVRMAYDWVVDNKKPIMRVNLPISWVDKDYKTLSALVLPLGKTEEAVNMLLLHFHFE